MYEYLPEAATGDFRVEEFFRKIDIIEMTASLIKTKSMNKKTFNSYPVHIVIINYPDGNSLNLEMAIHHLENR